MISLAESKFPDLSISISEMKRTVSFLTEIRPFRNYENVFVLDSIADWIKNEFQKNGLIPEYQEFEVNHKQYKNVIGVLNPEKSQRIIIGAHYDVCGNQPGADDNASAIAGLIETASVLKQFETEIDFRIDFVAYTLEEPPFFRTKNMGSYIC